eukprot:gene14093-15565_t
MATRLGIFNLRFVAKSIANYGKTTCNCLDFKLASKNIASCLVNGIRLKSTKQFYSVQSEREEEREQAYTHFGFENVTTGEKGRKVHDVFTNVAEKYDLMNDLMSGGLHRLWKDYFVRKSNPQPGKTLLDVAGGTGDIAFRYLDGVMMNQSDAMVDVDNLSQDIKICDINKSMLEVGRKRAYNKGINKALSFVVGDAENLPFEEDSVDLYTIAFGIRNVTHIEKVLDEAYRVLKPGGRFMCLEFSQVPNELIRNVYDSYSFQVIPVIGQIVAQDWHSYRYLVESIRKFPDQEAFAAMIEDAGFSNVEYENLTFGVVAIHSGFKI